MQPEFSSDEIANVAAKLGVKVVKVKSHRPKFWHGTTKRETYLAKWEHKPFVPGMVPVPHREQFAKDAAKDAFHA